MISVCARMSLPSPQFVPSATARSAGRPSKRPDMPASGSLMGAE